MNVLFTYLDAIFASRKDNHCNLKKRRFWKELKEKKYSGSFCR